MDTKLTSEDLVTEDFGGRDLQDYLGKKNGKWIIELETYEVPCSFLGFKFKETQTRLFVKEIK